LCINWWQIKCDVPSGTFKDQLRRSFSKNMGLFIRQIVSNRQCGLNMKGITISKWAAVVSRCDRAFLSCLCVYKCSLAGYFLAWWYWNICNDVVFCIACWSCVSYFLISCLAYVLLLKSIILINWNRKSKVWNTLIV
jgi:hypothetical protein